MFECRANVKINNEKLEKIWRDVREAANILHKCYFALDSVMEAEIPAAEDGGDGITDGSPVELTREAELHDNAQADLPKN